MFSLKLLLLPFISAFIGWFTNWIAIKMLFHPREPKKILGLSIQGLFPKRQQQFAASMGRLVSRELLHFEQVAAMIKDPAQLATLKPSIENHIDHFLRERLKEKLPVISVFVGQGTLDKIKEGLMEEIDLMLPQVIGQYTDNLGKTIDIEAIVTEKIANFSSDKMEEILMNIMSREFRFVEIIGGVLGFTIGLVQLVLTLW